MKNIEFFYVKVHLALYLHQYSFFHVHGFLVKPKFLVYPKTFGRQPAMMSSRNARVFTNESREKIVFM